MKTPRVLVLGTAVTLALLPLTSHAQVTPDTATMTTDTSLKRDTFLESFVRRWTRASALGEVPSNPDSVWGEVAATGILSAPSAFLNPAERMRMLDGTLFTLELRRGREYAFYEIAAGWPADDPTVLRVGRVADILSKAYRWR